MHFFSPANVMRLLEVVRGDKTATRRARDRDGARARRIGKVAVLVGVCHGFIGNRMLVPRQREANKLLLEGATPEEVDRVHVELRHADGAVPDERPRRRRHRLAPRPSKRESVREHPVREGPLGAEDRARASTIMTRSGKATPSPMVEEMIEDFAERSRASSAARSPTRRSSSAASTRWSTRARRSSKKARRSAPPTSMSSGSTATAGRSIAAARCTGPTAIGLGKILDRMKAFEAEHGPEFKPSALLEKLVAEGGSFAGYDKAARKAG